MGSPSVGTREEAGLQTQLCTLLPAPPHFTSSCKMGGLGLMPHLHCELHNNTDVTPCPRTHCLVLGYQGHSPMKETVCWAPEETWKLQAQPADV